jgi:hypothetical protein
MINREIKVGDRLRWLNAGDGSKQRGDDVFEIGKIDVENKLAWDTRGRLWASVFHGPEHYEHVDEPQADPVNHPPHYNAGEIECIDAIRAALGRDGFVAFCRGNAIKYLWRCEHKGGVEDWRKADWYINRAIKELGK